MFKGIAVAAILALAIGGVGYATAGNDQGTGIQAWAQVNPNGPLLVKTRGIVAVSSPLTGVYCLRAAAGVNLAQSAPVATQEANLSSTLGLVTPRRVGAPNSSCPPGELQIDTWDASNAASPTLVNSVGFDVLIP